MKKFKNSVVASIAVLLLYGCDQGIDPITPVAPGTDESAPAITINSPTEGQTIKVNEELASVDIDFEVTDDIEVASVKVMIDGKQIGSYSNFKDYRRLIVDDLSYDKLADGAHEMSVVATDIDGKTTTSTVNFTKEPAYLPKYAGELLYMPFDGDYTDLVSLKKATVEGDPGFTEESLAGPSAYAGAEESYLTLPGDRFKNGEFSAIFWMKVNAVPDRAGILVMSPPMEGDANDLTKGFRFFRENAGGMQRFKLNVGSGDTGNWFDGGEAADVDPAADKWVNMAFTISGTEAIVYIDGQIVKQDALDGIDWSDTGLLSIMSGAPNFTGWGHLSDQSFMDELRIFDRAISQAEIQQIMADDSGEFVSSYTPAFAGEMFYMPFDDNYSELFRDMEAEAVGNPGFAGESVAGSNAYAGATDSYLTFPINEMGPITTPQFSATLWYKLNADPDRAGILTISPEDPENENYPEVQNNRNSGFRLLREGNAERQVVKLNVGTGDGNEWADGGDAAALNPATATDWVHLAFTISDDSAKVYIDGEMVAEKALPGFDWTGTEILSIGSGAPRFTGWNHLSDLSYIDELRFYDKVLTQEEIQTIRDFDQ
ncbi:LamG-like jellyroll fold domain-containing protein [Pricia sp. S334]|uniref:LamG-like jellyroll fold domain-containing protein n=1 Tax=Pricia mediterranea TaxID=3076079 RepID=A0ABU3L6J8_9FLAO|nr:LamG-like jellyroll fold domain-containing protein [Pricia sp. S334]MDT7829375.1 LamG-like jellyroll fold domain-containing protein [Pricia sp. S334]